MANYSLEEVTSRRAVREFLNLPKRLYRNEPHWICPLDNDIENRFHVQTNELLNDGEVIRWIVLEDNRTVVGRIAAFYNRALVAASEYQPTGGCGFFESINDQQVANMLFDAARDWLRERGLEAMDGPINFGDRDQWWGLLTSGFDSTPLYTNPYNFEYYISLFENYGFRNYFNQHTYLRELAGGLFPDSVYQRVKRLAEEPQYRFEHMDKRHMSQYADDFREVYNQAWAGFSGVKPIDREHAHALLNKMRPIIDERLMYFAYYESRPIGFFLMVPDLNGVIGPFKGRFGLIQKLQFLWRLKVRHKATRIFAIIFGVVPEFQGKGIESGMIYTFEQDVVSSLRNRYQSLELAWIGDFNPVMMRMVENYVCAHKHKMHTTYRYLFDPEAEFHRAPRMGRRKPTTPAKEPAVESTHSAEPSTK